MTKSLVLMILLMLVVAPDAMAGESTTAPASTETNTFSNPVADGADPFVIHEDGRYYRVASDGGSIRVMAADTLPGVFTDPTVTDRWHPEPGTRHSMHVWAPELHEFRGAWYVYFAASDEDTANHRIYALRSGTGPGGPYAFAGEVALPNGKWAIDGTVLWHDADGAAGPAEALPYFLWSGWEGDEDVQQNLYIAAMQDATTATAPRVAISRPEHEWERAGAPPAVNEGPQVLRHGGRTFVIYSASGSWTDDYALGRLELVGADPMDASAWEKHPEPVFAGTETIKSPGHACFVRTASGEDWIVYHRARHPGSGWDRVIHLQRFEWTESGEPAFGEPLEAGETARPR